MKKILSIAMLLLLFAANSKAQSKVFTVTGKVISFEESFALEDVSVRVKGTGNVTATLSDGSFSIDVADENTILVFEIKGYEKQEVIVRDKKQIEVVLQRVDDFMGMIERTKHAETNSDKILVHVKR